MAKDTQRNTSENIGRSFRSNDGPRTPRTNATGELKRFRFRTNNLEANESSSLRLGSSDSLGVPIEDEEWDPDIDDDEEINLSEM